MALGKVTVWYMTEEERLAYIKKHPIVPSVKPIVSLENAPKAQTEQALKNSLETRKKQSNRIIDSVDKKYLHKLFMAGKSLSYIAMALKINQSTLNNYIQEQRKIAPEKWPYRK